MKQWEMLGRYLGVADSSIVKIDMDYSNRVQEKVYQLLSCWKEKDGIGSERDCGVKLSQSLRQLKIPYNG